MSKSTKEEKSWLRKMQNLLDKCPSKRLGFFTTGDPEVTVYDCGREAEINENLDINRCEFANSVENVGAGLGSLRFPNQVHSTAG